LLLEIFKSQGDDTQGRVQFQQADLNKPAIQSQFDNYALKWVESKESEDRTNRESKEPAKELSLPTNNTELTQKKQFVRKPLV